MFDTGSSTRLEYIDIAKGGAIILVVMGHIVQYNCQGESSCSVFNFIYGFHMPLFFFLSGYVAYLSRNRMQLDYLFPFLQKKTMSLLIPFLFWGFIVPILISRKQFILFPYKILNLVVNPMDGPWFLAVLFCVQLYYIIACLMSNIITKKQSIIIDAFSVLLLCAFIVLISKFVPFVGKSVYFSILYISMFLFGMVMSSIRDRGIRPIIVAISFFCFCFLSPLFKFGVSSSILKFSISVFACIVFLFISKSGYSSDPYAKGLAFLGKNSIEIYLTHLTLVHIISHVFVDTSDINAIPLFFIVFLLALVICILSLLISRTISLIPYFPLLLYGKIINCHTGTGE